MKENILIKENILSLAFLAYFLYEFISELIFLTSYGSHGGNVQGMFGYPVTFGWVLLNCFFWLCMVLGMVGILFKKRLGWSILLAGLFMMLIVLGYDFYKDRYNGLTETLIIGVKFMLVVIFLIKMLSSQLRSKLGISQNKLYYFLSLLSFMVLSILFLVVDKHFTG